MPLTPLEDLVVRPGRTIREVMRTIDEGSEAIALVVAADERLVGTVSDGDIRRALLGGAQLDADVAPFISRDPVTVPDGSDRAAVLDIMRARRLNQIPIVDDAGRLVGLHVLQEIVGGERRPNPALVLAGGRGTRLGQLTASVPKPMLPVAGRPILERIVLHLVGSGIENVYLSVGYLGEQIRRHFGDGSDFGCTITYLEEDPRAPLGTGGPLRGLLHDGRAPQHPALVMNGDLVTSFSVRSLMERHESAEASMTVAVREYAHDVPFGVVELDERDQTLIASLVEKPRWVGLVSAGIYVVEPDLLHLIPPEGSFPITDLAAICLQRGDRLAGWRLEGDWQDVGRPQELAGARGEDE
jgi:dTDP-glucose pyrophosphorylase